MLRHYIRRYGSASGLLQLTAAFLVCAVASAQPAAPTFFSKIRIEQKLNSQVPLGLTFENEYAQGVTLGQLINDKPVILSLVYYQCPMLCNQTLNGIAYVVEKMPLKLGRDYRVVTISFDQRETYSMAAAKKKNYVGRIYNDTHGAVDNAAESWHFLTGNAVSVRKVAEAVGFNYQWDSMTNQFAHASGIMVLTPEGKVSKYFYGVNYNPRDVRFGLEEASANKIGSPVDQILLLCYHYDPATGKYGVVVMRVLRIFGAATVFGICGMILFLRRRTSTPRRPGA